MNNEKEEKQSLKVLLVCGSGIVTSTLVAPEVESILNDLTHNNYVLHKGTIYDAPKYSANGEVDVILTTVPFPPDLLKQIKVPVITVTDLLRGRKKKVLEELQRVLKLK